MQIALSGTNTAAIYNRRTNVFFIGSNGYLTSDSGSSSLSESLINHFSLPRVSGLYDDLNPGVGGSISWKELPDRFAVTYHRKRRGKATLSSVLTSISGVGPKRPRALLEGLGHPEGTPRSPEDHADHRQHVPSE